ncbi:MAG: 16S rRNA (guanine(966)-N(2))-methyltransferase RsmD [Clostridiales bacterium]
MISGKAKGRPLKAPSGNKTRPTADRVKEAVFNVLSPYLAGSHVLDVFAGSGGLGIEALSREAASAVFLEADRKALAIIKENIAKTDLDNALVIGGDSLKSLALLQNSGQGYLFDLVFLDPPYNKGLLLPVLQALQDSRLLAEEAIIVVETAAKLEENFACSYYRQVKSSRYGDTQIIYLLNERSAQSG